MLKNKVLFSVIFSLIAMPTFADTLSELEFPKPPAYRVGISELPEKQYIQALHEKLTQPEKKYAQLDESIASNIADLTYADLSIKRISKEVAQELEFEEQDMLSDLSLLWQGAAVQSDTINFALYKLANPDADKPDSKSVKNVLRTIASMSTLVGASMGSPLMAGSSLIGGNILGIMSQDTKALNYKYTRVNDADMIILIRKVEDLQQKAVDLYYDYMTAKKQVEFANNLVEERQRNFTLAQKNNAPRELVVITDAYYRTALDKQRNAKSEFFSKRAALEQFVGNETFVQFEAELTAREKGEKIERPTPKYLEPDEETDVENQSEQVVPQPASNESAPELRGINTEDLQSDVSDDETLTSSNGVLTGSSSNIDEEKPKKKKFKFFKKDKKEVEEPENVKPKKVDKYSTKGLIFLHDKDKQTVINERKNNNKTPKVSTQLPAAQVATPKVDEYGFEPLDEIRVPDLSRGGYSIHSDYYEGINNSDVRSPEL